jgi:hypothetical protein
VTTVRAVYDQKEPYTDEEITAILDHTLQMDGGTHGYAKQPKTFRLLLEVMLATTLRVGDAVGFDPRALSKGDSLWIYTYQPQKQKRVDTPKLLEAYITDEMKKRIDKCAWLSERRPFWYGNGSDTAGTSRLRADAEHRRSCWDRGLPAAPTNVTRLLSARYFAACSLKTFRGFLDTRVSR